MDNSGHFGTRSVPIGIAKPLIFLSFFMGFLAKNRSRHAFWANYGGTFTPQPHLSRPCGHGTKQTSTYRIQPMAGRYELSTIPIEPFVPQPFS